MIERHTHDETVLRCVNMCCSAAWGGGEVAAVASVAALVRGIWARLLWSKSSCARLTGWPEAMQSYSHSAAS